MDLSGEGDSQSSNVSSNYVPSDPGGEWESSCDKSEDEAKAHGDQFNCSMELFSQPMSTPFKSPKRYKNRDSVL